MKLKHLSLFLGAMLMTLTACGGGDDPATPDDNGGKTVVRNNTNSNLNETNPVTHRMEFPRVKQSGSIILVHSLSNGEVNYSVEYDTGKKSTRWSCYEIYASNRTRNTNRWYNEDDPYPQDPLLPAQYRWSVDPFWRSGYDHGHLCPSGDRLNSQEANMQTFYLTNMAPQVNGFNAGVWANMENWVRNQINASSRDTIFVVKGGTIDNPNQYITMARTGGDMIIPSYYYMAVLMHNAQGYKAMGFWIEHRASSATNLSPYVVNIDQLEQNTGLDFFCNLPDDVENRIEGLALDNVKRAWGF